MPLNLDTGALVSMAIRLLLVLPVSTASFVLSDGAEMLSVR